MSDTEKIISMLDSQNLKNLLILQNQSVIMMALYSHVSDPTIKKSIQIATNTIDKLIKCNI